MEEFIKGNTQFTHRDVHTYIRKTKVEVSGQL